MQNKHFILLKLFRSVYQLSLLLNFSLLFIQFQIITALTQNIKSQILNCVISPGASYCYNRTPIQSWHFSQASNPSNFKDRFGQSKMIADYIFYSNFIIFLFYSIVGIFLYILQFHTPVLLSQCSSLINKYSGEPEIGNYFLMFGSFHLLRNCFIQNIKSWISQKPLIEPSSNFKLNFEFF